MKNWQRLAWRIVCCCCHTLRSWHHHHCHRYWQRLLCLYQYLSFSYTFRVTFCKNRSRIRHLKRSCSWISTNQCSLLVPVIAPVINIVEVQRFWATLAIVFKFTRLQRAYDFERELRESSELTRYEVELMYHYFASRTSQVILVVVETFLDLAIWVRGSHFCL